jgi:hypothetical protein
MTSSSQSLSACALFVAPRLCSTNSRCNKKSADNIRRRQGRSSAREILLRVSHRKFCWVSVVGVHRAPPQHPRAADVAVEQLGKARMKSSEFMRITVVPRLMTGRWRHHLGRGTEGYFKLDCPFVWDIKTQFEPVLIYVCLLYVLSRPRLSERGKLLDEFRGALPKADMPPLSVRRGRIVLRKLLFAARQLCSLPRSLVA